MTDPRAIDLQVALSNVTADRARALHAAEHPDEDWQQIGAAGRVPYYRRTEPQVRLDTVRWVERWIERTVPEVRRRLLGELGIESEVAPSVETTPSGDEWSDPWLIDLFRDAFVRSFEIVTDPYAPKDPS